MMRLNPILEEDLRSIVAHDLPWKSLEGKAILFVGINSFLVTYMVKLLLFLNENMFTIPVKIKGIYRNSVRAKKHYGKDIDYLELHQMDGIDQSIVHKTGHSDIIVHAASPASPLDFMNVPLEVVDFNIFLTKFLLDHATTYPPENFIYFSSSEIYGMAHSSKSGIKEDELGALYSLDLRSCYGESKRAGEMLCSVYYHSKKIPIKIIRPFHTYGPGMRLRDGRIFSDLVADILEKKPLSLKTTGEDVRSFCYLSDAIVAYFTVLLKGSENQAYNVGNPHAVCSMKSLANMLSQHFLNVEARIGKEKSLATTYIPNIKKMQDLGWQPTTCLKEGFLRTVRSYEYN